jgi:hypothetical protein
VEECGPCPVFASFTLAFALQVRKNTEKPQSEYSIHITKTTTHYKTLTNTHITTPPHTHTHTHVTKQYKTTTVQIKFSPRGLIKSTALTLCVLDVSDPFQIGVFGQEHFYWKHLQFNNYYARVLVVSVYVNDGPQKRFFVLHANQTHKKSMSTLEERISAWMY